MKLAIVGVTGLVGKTFLNVLEERNFPIKELIPVASKRSVGNLVKYFGREYAIVDLQTAINLNPDIALFSAGASISIEWAEKFADIGCIVVDNSSAWRMDNTKPLIIPEINARSLKRTDKIIANPNCSTIQMLMPLAPLHREYIIKRVIISTYQSISGTGQAALEQFQNERIGIKGDMAYPHQIDMNCLPHCDDFTENGYTKEELKLTNETKKILDSNIEVTATAVRVPVIGGHSESVNIEFKKNCSVENIKEILSTTPGVKLLDDPKNNIYPMPVHAHNKDDVFVGRIRQDFSRENCIHMWIVADNLRKGAATNAIQIAEHLLKNKLH